jgi:hypothetical protein
VFSLFGGLVVGVGCGESESSDCTRCVCVVARVWVVLGVGGSRRSRASCRSVRRWWGGKGDGVGEKWMCGMVGVVSEGWRRGRCIRMWGGGGRVVWGVGCSRDSRLGEAWCWSMLSRRSWRDGAEMM